VLMAEFAGERQSAHALSLWNWKLLLSPAAVMVLDVIVEPLVQFASYTGRRLYLGTLVMWYFMVERASTAVCEVV
jgi:hypothetical protein